MKRIAILAIGNAGGNMAEAAMQGLSKTILSGVSFIFADSSHQELSERGIEDGKTILLESGLDSFPQGNFEGLDQLVILSGFGGKTSNEFVEKAVLAAKDANVNEILVLATIPFICEGYNRCLAGLEAASRVNNIEGVELITFNNENLIDKYPNLNFFEALQKSDESMLEILRNKI